MRKVIYGMLLLVFPVLVKAQDSLYKAFKNAVTYKEVIDATSYNDGELLLRLDSTDLNFT